MFRAWHANVLGLMHVMLILVGSQSILVLARTAQPRAVVGLAFRPLLTMHVDSMCCPLCRLVEIHETVLCIFDTCSGELFGLCQQGGRIEAVESWPKVCHSSLSSLLLGAL